VTATEQPTRVIDLVLDTRDGDAAAFETLLVGLQRFAHEQVESMVVSLRFSGDDFVQEATLAQMVRGTVQAAALDLAQSGKRVNALLARDSTTPADLATITGYLHSAGAASMTGDCIDLTRRLGGPRPPAKREVAVLTGAAGAIGRVVAEVLGRAGRRLVLVDLAADALEEAARTIPNVVATHACDLTSGDQVDELIAKLEPVQPTAAVLLHGVPAGRALPEVEITAAKRQYAINATSATGFVTALAPLLASNGGGSIVALSSQAGLAAERGNIAYCAGKFALVGFAQAFAQTLLDQRVALHVLCPGPIDSPLMRAAFAGLAPAAGMSVEDYTAMRMAQIPLGRPGTPEEMAAAVGCLLALQTATGVVLAPTGGAVMT
jgi:NAD(P)-dependent dehydrogenase (short-subunit alcohol dehydrogenase family)